MGVLPARSDSSALLRLDPAPAPYCLSISISTRPRRQDFSITHSRARRGIYESILWPICHYHHDECYPSAWRRGASISTSNSLEDFSTTGTPTHAVLAPTQRIHPAKRHSFILRMCFSCATRNSNFRYCLDCTHEQQPHMDQHIQHLHRLLPGRF